MATLKAFITLQITCVSNFHNMMKDKENISNNYDDHHVMVAGEVQSQIRRIFNRYQFPVQLLN